MDRWLGQTCLHPVARSLGARCQVLHQRVWHCAVTVPFLEHKGLQGRVCWPATPGCKQGIARACVLACNPGVQTRDCKGVCAGLQPRGVACLPACSRRHEGAPGDWPRAQGHARRGGHAPRPPVGEEHLGPLERAAHPGAGRQHQHRGWGACVRVGCVCAYLHVQACLACMCAGQTTYVCGGWGWGRHIVCGTHVGLCGV